MTIMSSDNIMRDYDGFIELLEHSEESDDLPITLELTMQDNATVRDIRRLCERISKDSGLETRLETYYCFQCGKMHTQMTIDYPEFEDTGYPVQ